jgi:uncharacterized delta-60 repeat protein
MLSPNGGVPVRRNHIARLNPDGTLDTAFDPDAMGFFVSSIVLQADGKILVGGSFNSIGGGIRNNIARLDPATGLADSFDPHANSFVYSIAVQADGKILAGGLFSPAVNGTPTIGGQTRNCIARLDPTTGLADSFNPNASGSTNNFYPEVDSIAVQTDGKILASGNFTSIGGQMRHTIARLDPTTGTADSFDPNPFGGVVFSILVQPDGKILVGGGFSSIGGQARNGMARLDALTGLADSFDPSAYGGVGSIAVEPNGGKIIVGGGFIAIGGRRRNNVARLDATTGLADFFDPNANGGISSIAIQADGKILLGGSFSHYGGTPTIGGGTRNFIARFLPPLVAPTPTPGPSPKPTVQAVNLSTRMRVQTGDGVGIVGFIVTGEVPKRVLLRALGPSLTQAGVPGALVDPAIQLYGPEGFLPITNSDWRADQVQEAAIIATGIPPPNDLEAAIDVSLIPGAYTAIVTGESGASGVALIEAYDVSQGDDSKLANLSTRAFVGTSDNIVIAGFILDGEGGDTGIVVRGIGPSLTAVGVPGALADPALELRDENGALRAANNDWQDNPIQAAELMAAGLAPTNQFESGIALVLPPGLYTALLAGRNGGTGIGLVEVYDRGALN